MLGERDPMKNDPVELRMDLKRLLVKKLRLHGVAPETIADDAPLLQGPLGLDSIDILELAVAVEERYQVKVSDEQLGREAFRSIAALAEFLRTDDRAPEDESSPGA